MRIEDDFKWFTGVVEDRDDPEKLNRVRVRIFGAHTDIKSDIATADLPWATVMMPTTSSSNSGLGQTVHGLVEGSWVVGFWKDGGSKQDPMIMGSFIGINKPNVRTVVDIQGTKTEKPVSSTGEDKISTAQRSEVGFIDPRIDDVADYGKGETSTPEGINPPHNPTRNTGLTLDLNSSPRQQGGEKAVNYPREQYKNKSDVNEVALGWLTYPNDKIQGTLEVKEVKEVLAVDEVKAVDAVVGADGVITTPAILASAEVKAVEAVAGADAVGGLGKTLFTNVGLEGKDSKADDEDRVSWVNSKYPFNHIYESESGHVIEIDDTPGYERINLYHRKGARIEINNEGEIHVLAAPGQDLNLQAANVNINNRGASPGGQFNVNCEGEFNVNSVGDCTVISKGDTSLFASGDTSVLSTGNNKITALGKNIIG